MVLLPLFMFDAIVDDLTASWPDWAHYTAKAGMILIGPGKGTAAARGGGLVIGRGKDLAKPGALRAGEYKLGWPSKLPDWKGEWKENAGRLREAMRQGGPIRDVSPDDLGGPFLNAERNLLRDRGWTFDPRTNYWNPPGP